MRAPFPSRHVSSQTQSAAVGRAGATNHPAGQPAPNWPVRVATAPRRVISLIGLVTAVLSFCSLILLRPSSPLEATVPRQPGFHPTCVALVDATVTVAPGKTLQHATLVLRDGRVAAVGSDVQPPPEAERIDASGLFVYPGFIDAGSSSPLPDDVSPQPRPGRPMDFGSDVLAATRPDNRNGLTPEFRVAALSKLDEKKLLSWQQTGFTAVHVVPSGRIASGQSALVTTSGVPLREAVLRPDVCVELRLFVPRGSRYPATLMGAVAHLRQALLDARRYQQHWQLFEQSPQSVPRPPFDPALEALASVASGQQAVLFLATSRDDIHRALDFAREQKLKVAALWGATQAGECLTRLRQLRTPLLVQLDFGDEPKVKKPAQTEELQPDTQPPLRVQEDKRRRWLERIQTLTKLEKARIPFAFSSRGLKSPSELLKQVRLAVEHGLSPKTALAALTVNAARILGVENQLGTLQPGKLAHVVVFNGPFEDKRSLVHYVFVDGLKFQFNREAKPLAKSEEKAKSSKEPKAKPGNAQAKNKSASKPVELTGVETVEQPKSAGAGRGASQKQKASKPESPPQKSVSASGKRPAGKKAGGGKVAATPAEQPTELESDRLAGQRGNGNLFVRGGTVWTGTGVTLQNASILIERGRIKAIGQGLRPPKGFLVVDARGRYIIPGIVDPHSHIMISGGANEGTQSIVCEVRVRDAVRTDDVAEYRALAGGVTTVRLLHGSANVIGGQNAVVKLKYGRTAREHLVRAPQGVKFALGENVKGRPGRFPNTRLGVEATLRRAFAEAAAYRDRWLAYEKSKDKSRLLPPRRDLRLETLADILQERKLIDCHCYRSDEILMVLRVAESLGIRVNSLQHALEAYKVAPEIARHGASVSTFSDWWAYKVEAYDATPYNAALLLRAGVNACLKSDNAELMRHLYQEAAKLIRYGNVPPDEALRTVTLNPARELGLDRRIGTIEVGKDGDLAIFNGHPLNAFSRCEMTIIEGVVYFDRSKQPTAMSGSAVRRTRRAGPLPAAARSAPSRSLDLSLSPNGRYAIVNATVHPVDRPTWKRATVVIDGGRIAAVGPKVPVPDDAKVIDATGLHVYPGLIDAGTTLGLTEIGKVAETHDYAEIGLFHPDLRAGVAVNPDSELVAVARAGGITTVLATPTGGVVCGQASLVNLAGWTAPEMTLQLEAGLVIRWPRGESAKKRIDQLRELFGRARVYERARQRKGTTTLLDPRLEALLPYLHGQKPVLVEAHSRKQIVQALQFAEQQKLRLVLVGATDAWKVASELKRRKVPVIVGKVMRGPVESYDPSDAAYANAGRLYEAGVRFCFRSDSSTNSRNLPFEAAMAVAFGLPESAALRALTLSAAEILDVRDQLGSITPGKLANLVITDGSPLQPATHILGVFIAGRPYPPESRHTRLYRRYRQRLQQVTAAESQRQ